VESIIYARVSSAEQSEGYSIDAQRGLLNRYAKEKGFTVVKEFIEVESAKASGRPVFNAMMEFIKLKKIPLILVEKTDRLYRNLRDWVSIDDLKVDVHLVKEGEVMSEGASSSTKFVQGIKVLMAKQFIDNLREETRKGMFEKAEQGGVPFLSPIGYLNKDRTVEVDSERSPLVIRAFELYAKGDHSLSTLRDELNRLGLKTKKGIKITIHGVEKMLKNPFYTGWFNWSGRLWKGKHTPLIPKELFDKVGGLLSGRNRSKPRSRHFAFRGLLKCGYCGCMITAGRQKEKYVYYTCTRGKGRCEQEYYREEKIDRLFSDAIGTLYIDDKIKAWIVDALKHSHEDERLFVEAEVKRLQSEYQKNETNLHKCYEDKLSGVISEEFFKVKFSEINGRQREVETELDNLKKKNLGYLEQGILILELLQNIKSQYDKASLEQKAKIMKILLLNCELKGANTRFYWNKPFDILFELGKTKRWGPTGCYERPTRGP